LRWWWDWSSFFFRKKPLSSGLLLFACCASLSSYRFNFASGSLVTRQSMLSLSFDVLFTSSFS
jgi:hypothetical protein